MNKSHAMLEGYHDKGVIEMKKIEIVPVMTELLFAVTLASAILFFFCPTIVRGESMENTLQDRDYIIVAKQAYRSHEPERGDVVIVQSALTNDGHRKNRLIIKRIIGLPGDIISIRNSRIYINGEIGSEEYTKDGITPAIDIPKENGSVTVPANCCYLLGDNRCNSLDSRSYEIGFVKIENIKGKAVLRLFPFSEIRIF